MLSFNEKVLIGLLVVVIFATSGIVIAAYLKGQEMRAACSSIGGVLVETIDKHYVCAPRKTMI
jgi:hypothetical protein